MIKTKVEIWKDIQGFEGLYQVSNYGNVRSVTRYKKNLKPQIDKDGYRTVILKNKGIETHKRVSRLVATAFIPKPQGREVVNHIDMNRQNDTVVNLEWCTPQENVAHSVKHGKYKGHGHIQVIQIQNGVCVKVWGSMSEAARALNISAANIYYCVVGKRKHAGGYEWKGVL